MTVHNVCKCLKERSVCLFFLDIVPTETTYLCKVVICFSLSVNEMEHKKLRCEYIFTGSYRRCSEHNDTKQQLVIT